MRKILQDVRKTYRRPFAGLLILNILVALTAGFGTVMLVPMLDLLQIQVDGSGVLDDLLRPFAALPLLYRAGAVLAMFMVIMIARALLMRVATIRQNEFLERYELDLRKQLYDAIANADWQTLSRKKQGELVTLFTIQCRQAKFCLQWIIGLFASAASAALQLAIACWLSLPLTLMVLIVGIGFLLALRPFQKRSRACGEESVEASRAMYREIQNQLNSIKETRAYGVEEENLRLFEQVNRDYYDISLRATQLRVKPQLCYNIAAAILIALAFVVSVLIMKLDAARLVILVYIFSRLWPVFSSWQGQLQNIQSYLPAFDQVKKAMDSLQSCSSRPNRGQPLAFTKEICFRDVCFSYSDAPERILEHVSFDLPFGSVTALAGRSGAGKSTTADLLLGLLRPTEGKILVDGVELTEENMGLWRSALGYVPQQPLIIDATVRENLRRFHPEATEEEMIRALKDALAWPFVEKLEKGLDTVLGAKGIRLSGGEQQRIVLARVLLGNPRLIILDEATSALDYESEAMIRQTIKALRGKTTVVIIAHRLATIRSADRAIVLENRQVAESGALTALLNNENGYLARMVTVE